MLYSQACLNVRNIIIHFRFKFYFFIFFVQDIPKANANPQRVALKDTQDLKVRLRQFQLSASNSQANHQKGQNATTLFNGCQKPVSGGQLSYKKETGYKPTEKQEQCSSSMLKQNYIQAQRTDHSATASSCTGDENKENEQKEAGKSKSARYVNSFVII